MIRTEEFSSRADSVLKVGGSLPEPGRVISESPQARVASGAQVAPDELGPVRHLNMIDAETSFIGISSFGDPAAYVAAASPVGDFLPVLLDRDAVEALKLVIPETVGVSFAPGLVTFPDLLPVSLPMAPGGFPGIDGADPSFAPGSIPVHGNFPFAAGTEGRARQLVNLADVVLAHPDEPSGSLVTVESDNMEKVS